MHVLFQKGIDGIAVDASNMVQNLVGSDVPGSVVVLTVIKGDTQQKEDVHLVRMSTEEILDRRNLFEHFTELKFFYAGGGGEGCILYEGEKSVCSRVHFLCVFVQKCVH